MNGLAVPVPRIEGVWRRTRGALEVGDRARVRCEPGLIALLEGLGAGAGYQPRANHPLGLAVTAVWALLEGGGGAWAGREASVRWHGFPSPGDRLLAEARVAAVDERGAELAVAVRTAAGVPLLEGTVRMVRVDRPRMVPVAAPATAPDRPGGLVLAAAPRRVRPGERATVAVAVGRGAEPCWVLARPPFGGGLRLDGPMSHEVAAGDGVETVTFELTAVRPDGVNLGRPWQLRLSSHGLGPSDVLEVPVEVAGGGRDEVLWVLVVGPGGDELARAAEAAGVPVSLIDHGGALGGADVVLHLETAEPEAVRRAAARAARRGGRPLGPPVAMAPTEAAVADALVAAGVRAVVVPTPAEGTNGGRTGWWGETADLARARLIHLPLVELGPNADAGALNRELAARLEAQPRSGVRVVGLVAPTGAVGEATINAVLEHLEHLRQRITGLRVSTCGEAVAALLDEVAPTPVAMVGWAPSSGDPETRRWRFPVRVLGRELAPEPGLAVPVSVPAPLHVLPETVASARLMRGDEVLAALDPAPEGGVPELSAALDGWWPDLSLSLELVEGVHPAVEAEADGVRFRDPVEPARADLLRLRPPQRDGPGRLRVPGDVLRLLMAPIAGGAEPLGRRVHPLGGVSLGAAITAAQAEMDGGTTVARARMRWLAPPSLDADLVATAARVASGGDSSTYRVEVADDAGRAVADCEVVVQARPDAGAAAAVAPSTPSLPGNAEPPGGAMTPDLELIDLRPRLLALDPHYLAPPVLDDPHQARVTTLAFAVEEGRLYLVVGGAWLFASDDGLATLREVAEVNTCGGELVPASVQAIDMVVETLDGTVLLIGRDRRADDPSSRAFREGERGVVWRKPRGHASFVRQVVTDPAWATSRSGNASAGFFGPDRLPMVAVAPYTASDAHLYWSLDDGRSWRRHDLGGIFRDHVHEVYLPRLVGTTRTARLWVTGGDDPSGEASGVICIEGFDADRRLAEPVWVLRERPGFRLVGLAGDGKHVFVGNESVAGGVIRILDNRETIAAGDFEYVLGKCRHDYHQFRGLLASFDGLLAAGSSSYRWTGDCVRADSGGALYVSADGGVSFAELGFGGTWVTALADDGRFLWGAVSASRDSGGDVSARALTLFRLRRPSPLDPPSAPYVARPVVLDSSSLYELAGEAVHPHPRLEPSEASFRVDMSPFREVAVVVEALSCGELAVEGLPFHGWRLEEDLWHELARLVFDRPGRRTISLEPEALAYRHLRVRNQGEAALELAMVSFVGRR